MAAFSHPAYFVLDPFLEPERFSSSIITTSPYFSPIISHEHVQEIPLLHADHHFHDTIHPIGHSTQVVPSTFTSESHVTVNETLSSPSWVVNDLERVGFHQDATLINPVQEKRKHLAIAGEKENIGEKECRQNCETQKSERKRLKPRAKKQKKVADIQPLTNYVHVRARRGEATDPHSLAERVRRKKISVRMKLLQSLVPGCDKLTGKALILDEIIRYVLSLQHQVEFLAAKLAPESCIANEVNYDMNPQVAKELFSSVLEESSSTQLIPFMEATPAASMLHHEETTNATTQVFDYI